MAENAPADQIIAEYEAHRDSFFASAPKALLARLKQRQQQTFHGQDELRELVSSTEETLQKIEALMASLQTTFSKAFKERPYLFKATKERFASHLTVDFTALRTLLQEQEKAFQATVASAEDQLSHVVKKFDAVLARCQGELQSFMSADLQASPEYRLVKLPCVGGAQTARSPQNFFEWPTEAQFKQMSPSVFLKGATYGSQGYHMQRLRLHLSSGDSSEPICNSVSELVNVQRLEISDPTSLSEVRLYDNGNGSDVFRAAVFVDRRGQEIAKFDPGNWIGRYAHSKIRVAAGQVAMGFYGYHDGTYIYRLGLIVKEKVSP